MEKTTIQISKDTLERLKDLKRFERESYDCVINLIADEYIEENLTKEEIEDIQKALEEVKRGETIPFENVLKEAGINLD